MDFKRLPEAEFEIMKLIWALGGEPTSPEVLAAAQRALPEREWKAQTVLTFLARLEKKGFLVSFKRGRERSYRAEIGEAEYMRFEADSFAASYGGSASGLVKALYDGRGLSKHDIDELKNWLADK